MSLTTMRINLTCAIMLLGTVLTAPPVAISGNYTFTQIDVPGADSTFAGGINDTGQIVGSFSSNFAHGFLKDGVSFTQIDFPNATTRAQGINNKGQIVGQFYDHDTGGHGFLMDGATVTQIDVLGALLTNARSINDMGQIVGNYSDVALRGHGFLKDGATIT